MAKHALREPKRAKEKVKEILKTHRPKGIDNSKKEEVEWYGK